MDDLVRKAILQDNLVDITTIGRKSGKSHRIEVNLRHIDGQVYLSHEPVRRHWVANILANPEFTYHVKQSARADLPARAVRITDKEEQRRIYKVVLGKEGRAAREVEERVQGSHLFRVEFAD